MTSVAVQKPEALQRIAARAQPRVFYLVDSLNIGGTETQMAQAAIRLRKTGYDVVVGCLNAEGPLGDKLRDAQIPAVEFRKGRSLLSLNGIYQLLRLAVFLRRGRFQVMHAHDLWSNLLGVPAARLAGVPLVIASRRYLADLDWYTRMRRWIVRFVYGLADCVIVNSKSVRDLLVNRDHVPESKIRVLYNAVDVQIFGGARRGTRAANSAPRIAVVANMYSAVKGHKNVIAAARRVCSEFPDAVFILIGDGQERAELEKQVRAEGLERSLQFLGRRNDVPELLAGCDVSVLASESEALPNALLESMAAGMPVVATRVGGNSEAIEEGVNGLLVPPNAPQALAAAIVRTLHDPEWAQALGRAGRERAASLFSFERLLSELESLYGFSSMTQVVSELQPIATANCAASHQR